MEERIVACAFRDSKDGKIYISRMCHAEIIGMFFGAQDKETSHRCEQGFITNLDRFVDRKEALQIARNAKQELHKWCDTDELYSEDIFWNPFEEEKIKEQEKIIELMAKEMSEEDENFLYRNTSDIIDYFKKKAKGE